tara:strand:+ start:1831 stop:2100 length:270 start_codon:yes stop_codon:yes gene_type:complete
VSYSFHEFFIFYPTLPEPGTKQECKLDVGIELICKKRYNTSCGIPRSLLMELGSYLRQQYIIVMSLGLLVTYLLPSSISLFFQVIRTDN